jgi:hypothetical protein
LHTRVENAGPDSSELRWLLPSALLAGFVARLIPAFWGYFNPDEVMHYLLSVEPSLSATYQASKAVTHPPLLILVLHYWRFLGTAEWWLRMPSILASIGFCWFAYRWLCDVWNESAARILLVLLLFAPSFILLSAEIRQYALLWLFASASLYFLDRAILRSSASAMLFSVCALLLAILSHYSAFLVALVLGIYAFFRLFQSRSPRSLWAIWLAGQVAGFGLSVFLITNHVSQLKRSGLAQTIADTYLRKSIYQRGQENVFVFVGRSNIRLFHYFFSQGAVGAVALALFIAGIVILAKHKLSENCRPTGWQLAFLCCMPLVLNCGLGVAGVYPYGGTRHDSYLALFAMPAIAIALDRWKAAATRAKLSGILAVLLVCILFRTPMGEFIRWKDQKRSHMIDAVHTLQRLPQGATILADTQGAMELSYYLCDSKVAQFFLPYQPFAQAGCGSYQVISIDPDRWLFKAETLPEDFSTVARTFAIAPDTRVWFLQAGWDVDRDEKIRARLLDYGCPAPQKFGRNILLCPVTLAPSR